MALIKELLKLPKDPEIIGYRGLYLLENSSFIKIPQVFVIQPLMIDEFLNYNSALIKINSITSNEDLFKLFDSFQFPKGMEEELQNLFELLIVENPSNVEELFSESESKALLRLIASPNYLLKEDFFTDTFFDSYTDFEGFKSLLKKVIASMFTYKQIKYRETNNIGEFKLAVLIEKLDPYERHAIVFCSEDKIVIKGKFGLFDFREKGYDKFVFDKTNFDVLEEDITFQEEELKLKKGSLIYAGIRNVGMKYKINLKESEHLARIAKRISQEKNKKVLALFHFVNNFPILSLIDLIVMEVEQELEIDSEDLQEMDASESREEEASEESSETPTTIETEALEEERQLTSSVEYFDVNIPQDYAVDSKDNENFSVEISESSEEEFIIDESIVTNEEKRELVKTLKDFLVSNCVVSEEDMATLDMILSKDSISKQDLQFIFSLLLDCWD